MRAVQECIEQADRNGFDIFRNHFLNDFFQIGFIQRLEDFSFRIDPFIDGEPQIAGDQRGDVPVMVIILFFPDSPAHFQRVADALGGNQGSLGSVQGQQGVGSYGSAVDDGADVCD